MTEADHYPEGDRFEGQPGPPGKRILDQEITRLASLLMDMFTAYGWAPKEGEDADWAIVGAYRACRAFLRHVRDCP